MNLHSEDEFERLVQRALSVSDGVRAPEGFAERVEMRLLIERLRATHLTRVRQAWSVAVGGLAALAGVAVLFIEAVDVPAWAVENVPGLLGRVDAAVLRLGGVALPALLTAVGGLAAVTARALLRRRETRAGSTR